MAQDALEDAVLMGCDETQFRQVTAQLARGADQSLQKGRVRREADRGPGLLAAAAVAACARRPGARAAADSRGAARPRQDHGAGFHLRCAGRPSRSSSALWSSPCAPASSIRPRRRRRARRSSIIDEVRPGGTTVESKRVFSGWMFASSPAVSAMEDPIYDVNVLDCKIPTTSAAPSSGAAGK